MLPWLLLFLHLAHGSLTPSVRSACQAVSEEGRFLLQRLSAFQARVSARLMLEEGIEESERQHRAGLQLTPLPTAVPRVYEPGDSHVAVEELPGLAGLTAEQAHEREFQAQQARVAQAQAQAQGLAAPPAAAAAAAPPSPPPLPLEQRLAVEVGVLLARVRALPLLRLHGLGVEEDYQGHVTAWARNVTLEQLFATAPGWQYDTDAQHQGAGNPGSSSSSSSSRAQPLLNPHLQPTLSTPPLLSPHSFALLGLAYRALPVPPPSSPQPAATEAAAAAAAQAAAAQAAAALGQSLYQAGAARASAMLAGVPLLQPVARAGSSGSSSGSTIPIPQFLPSDAAPRDAAFAGAPPGGMLLDPSRGQLPFARRPRLNPAPTHRYSLLTPLFLAYTGQEARTAAGVRALQALGLLLAPVRGVWELLGLGVQAVVPAWALARGRALGGAGAHLALVWAPGAAVQAGEGLLWRCACGLGLAASAAWAGQVAYEAAFGARLVVGRGLRSAGWAWGVAWGTGAELFCAAFPVACTDASYHRAEVSALARVLALAKQLEEELQHKVQQALDKLQEEGQQ